MSKIALAVMAIALVAAPTAWSDRQHDAPEPPAFTSQAHRHDWVMGTLLPWMEQFRERYHNVPRSDGEFLRWLVITTKRKRALEIGTANGYSAIWLGLGLEVTGGQLTTVEIRSDLVQEARANLKRAGLLGQVVTVMEGDALRIVPKLEGKFDFAFVDTGPRPLPFVEAVLSQLTDDAILAVHRPPSEGALSDYLAAMRKRPEWLTTIVRTGASTAIVLSARVPKRST